MHSIGSVSMNILPETGSASVGKNYYSLLGSGPNEESFLANIEVNVFAVLVSDETTKVAACDAMPDAFVFLFECALHVRCQQFLAARCIKCLLSFMNGEVFHLILHVDELDYWVA